MSAEYHNRMLHESELGEVLNLLPNYLKYDEASKTGLRWLMGSRKGKEAGTLTSHGYWKINFKGHQIYNHRVVWFLRKNEWPHTYINHENLIRSDNKIENLTKESHKSNSQYRRKHRDNTSGITGVGWITDNRFGLLYANCFYMDDGKPVNKRFSVKKFGKKAAWDMAVAFRQSVIDYKIEVGEKYLREEG